MNNKKLVVLGTVGVVTVLGLGTVLAIRSKNKKEAEEYCRLFDFLNQIKKDIYSYTEGEQFKLFMKELRKLYNLPISNRKELEEAFNRAHDLHDRVMDCI